ncbi:SET domain-containing protein-lysine N-methyltransferase [Allochromatium palmeri]|uniref:SET domain-containing protein-lysine N-methyltransferase n=1 Tax=Allochromatium palmeri TaxID=231048 RepID=A0A6N8EG43_9GAMM|nr:SET domain-containing protein-lysine N-methyltransferase [Allochromatium palmeri]
MRRRSAAETLDRRVRVGLSSIHGQGCFARIGFEPGDYIGTFEGLEVEEDGPHVLWVYDPERDRLIGRRGTNVLRWLNHSDDPNAEFDGFELYARLTIAVGSEITIDYSASSS